MQSSDRHQIATIWYQTRDDGSVELPPLTNILLFLALGASGYFFSAQLLTALDFGIRILINGVLEGFNIRDFKVDL
ncbi:hypothetical protein RCL_jg3952.t1 [Rhizophagus clarus]|uniref:Uncharacterized protein n=1 Tax=Rhizophagus clarus TaxID=94130 RepID=A0A8H3KU38_9GLOM|nr:hypothetical protein RCL_jg3952.t1 [Rhizophagus clarus]